MKKVFIGFLCTAGLLLAQGFTLKSSDISGQLSNKQVFNGSGCTGENISPKLSWENAPTGTQSFAVMVYDPDAPTGSGWWHWVVFDIPKDKTSLQEGFGNSFSKMAIQSMTDFGKTGFGGACPPVGDKPHRYIFTVFALDIPSLGLDENAKAALVGFYLNAHTLAKASLMAYYGRE
ncbi:MAG: YbhB/YbcL family Raf kinase inhibitor-like protein [Candidatus Marinarcus sp.]|uniref:YbhB/YbcL family Raf kinase inhibitor-like protein n=1 Tax=Candidatus Marinarcus sp. TaxID=3100987 RepID=UPI003B00EB0B